MKLLIKRIIITCTIICILLATAFSNFTLAVESSVVLTQERAGNYVSTFAINFYNNWSSDNSKYKETETVTVKNEETGEETTKEIEKDLPPIRTEYNESAGVPSTEKIGDNDKYYFSKKSWIDFVYLKAISIGDTNAPSRGFGASTAAFEKIQVGDMVNILKLSNDKKEEDSSEDNQVKTIVELVNSGAIKPGDILVTNNGMGGGDYLLYVGGTKVIYATPDLATAGAGALKYDYVQNYLVDVDRKIREANKGKSETEINEIKYGVESVYRIKEDFLINNNITENNAKTFYNGRGYYDIENQYQGLPTTGTYEGRTHNSFIGFVINGLYQIIKFLVNLILYVIRAVILGWVNIIENFIQTVALQLSGISSQAAFEDKGHGISPTAYSGRKITVESMIFNHMPLTDINFFNIDEAGGVKLVDENGNSTTWLRDIRVSLATWYYVIRNMSIALMLIVLLYTGVRMLISAIPEKRAGYSKAIIGWVKGLCIVFFIHFFMYAVININNQFVDFLFERSIEEAGNILGDSSQALTLYDAVRTKALVWNFFDGTAALIIYIILVYYLVRYLYVYLKRFVAVYVLTLLGSVIGVKYAIDTATGKKTSSIFVNWMKQYIFNVLLQTIHAIVYTILMALALEAALSSVGGIIVAIIVLQFMIKSDKIVMNIFGISGSLLNDANEKPQSFFSIVSKIGFARAMAEAPIRMFQAAFDNGNPVVRFARYIANYEEGDKAKDVQRKIDLKDMKWKSRKALALYAINPLAYMPIRLIQDRIRAYQAIGDDNLSYEMKKSILNTVNAQKKINGQRFTRPVQTTFNKLYGTVETIAGVGLLGEDTQASIATIASGIGKLKNNDPSIDIKYRNGEIPTGGFIGGLIAAERKDKKDFKKQTSINKTQLRIADYERQLYETMSRIKQEIERQVNSVTSLTADQKAQAINRYMTRVERSLKANNRALNEVSVRGDYVRRAVNRYMAQNPRFNPPAGTPVATLQESDIAGVLTVLDQMLAGQNTQTVIDATTETKIRDALSRHGMNINNTDEKEFGRMFTEAFHQQDVTATAPIHTNQFHNATIQANMEHAVDLMQAMRGINQGSVTKDKKPAIGYNSQFKRMLKDFKGGA